MSDTPRTDAFIEGLRKPGYGEAMPRYWDFTRTLERELNALRRKVAAAEGLVEALQLAVSDVDNGLPANPQVNGPDLHVECQQVLIEAGWFEEASAAIAAWKGENK